MAVATVAVGQVAAQKLDTLVWGLLFIWIGVSLLAGFGWGIGLLGVGLILVVEQIARKYVAMAFETFWLVVGVVFVIGGSAELLNFHISLIPVACIVAGVALLISAVSGRAKE
jgi:hypothetical protein